MDNEGALATQRIAQLAAHRPLRIRYARGELIAQHGTYAAGLSLITSGLVVETYVSGDACEATGFAGPGDLLSTEVLLEQPHVLHQTTIRALTDVSISFLERGTLRAALNEDAKLRGLILSGLSEQLLSVKRGQARAHAPLEARLLWLLQELGAKAGSNGGSERIRVPSEIDRRVLAEILGVSGRRLSRLWGELDAMPAAGGTVRLNLTRIRAAADQSVSSTIER